jgi:hypothetical protein
MPTQTENQKTPQTEHNIKLTSSEIANIWTNYMSDTAAICTLNSYMTHVEDKEIRSIIEFTLKLSEAHVQKLQAFLTRNNIQYPMGSH